MAILNNDSDSTASVVERTTQWIEAAVIALNLCPFAKIPFRKHKVRVVVTDAADEAQLLKDLADELALLRGTDASEIETTLLVHPQVLTDFLNYNDFLDTTDALLEALELEGQLQVASFHPQYQFADTQIDDISNCSNRAPFPTLHILREASIDQAVASVPDTDAIFERNVATLRELGWEGWRKLARIFHELAR